jgi:uncharacterized protein (DUF952 family)
VVDLPVGSSSRIYHIAFEQDWIDAQSTGEYGVSTSGRQLGDLGYIPASFAHQVHLVGGFSIKELRIRRSYSSSIRRG